MVTLFTTCRPFEGDFSAIQRNALRSWTAWPRAPEVLVLGDEPGVKDCCENLGVRHLPEVERSASGVPRMDDLFGRAERAATTEVLAYANADVLLLSDVRDAIERVQRQMEPPYLLIARRWNVRFPPDWTLAPADLPRLREYARTRGTLEPVYGGTDLFAWPRGAWDHLPPLAIGRGRWDSALIYEARSRGWPVVDATAAGTVIHQDHEGAVSTAASRSRVNLDERENEALLGGAAFILTPLDATHELRAGEIRPRRVRNPIYVLRRLATLPARSPRWRALRPAVEALAPVWRLARRAASRRSR